MTQEMPEEIKCQTWQQQAIKRFAEPSDIAGAVCFLSSEDASFLTGQALPFGGGHFLGRPLSREARLSVRFAPRRSSFWSSHHQHSAGYVLECCGAVGAAGWLSHLPTLILLL
ncbi:SDR family oxidoreductase [Pseudomonas sp. S3E12]|uniref:SDR family oxidoreductase n=1 Tax=Pseudomonas sp. S3E12 TaxID=1873126 RepID=UPI00353213FE